MGIFDLGFDAPDTNGWATRVTPGAADPNNLSLAERVRATLAGSTDPNPQMAKGLEAAGKAANIFAPKPPLQQQAAATEPKMPPKPGIDPQLLASLAAPSRSPFGAVPGGSAGKPAAPHIYPTSQPSPFTAT